VRKERFFPQANLGGLGAQPRASRGRESAVPAGRELDVVCSKDGYRTNLNLNLYLADADVADYSCNLFACK
jgi:hypothetical protein